MKLRDFAGCVNRCNEVLIPVYFADDPPNRPDGLEGDDECEAFIWAPVQKAKIKELVLSRAKELGIDEVDAVLDPEDNNLYLDGGGEDGEEEDLEEENEVEEEEEVVGEGA